MAKTPTKRRVAGNGKKIVTLARKTPRLTDILAPGRHSSCLICGALYFDRLVSACPRCGGEIHLYTESDLRLLARRTEQIPAVNTSELLAA